MDDIIEPLLQRTLYLWLVPYAALYVLVFVSQRVWDWVTEPEQS